MTLSMERQTELAALIDAVCDGIAATDERARLEAMLLHDSDAQWFYLQRMHLNGVLLWQQQATAERDALRQLREQNADPPHALPALVTSCASAPSAPPLGLFGNAFHSAIECLPQGAFFSYLVAAITLGFGVLLGSFVHVSHPGARIAEYESATPTAMPAKEFVGRITGMVDCQWADPNTAALGTVAVPRGRQYALTSGLLEITYDTGARVILQGPCTYKIESRTGGYLSVGKLTARVDKKGNDEGKVMNDELRAGKNGIPHSAFRIQHLFAVRTPTATVTDFGTEFGVEVNEQGGTTSHVFQGSVEVRVVPVNGEKSSAVRVLHENESAVVKVAGDARNAEDRLAVSGLSAQSGDFVRTIVKPTIKSFDLVDVVAGGDGFSGRRDGAIDPSNGQVPSTPFPPGDAPYVGDGQYHPVASRPLVDGVFIPDGRAGRVQVDSAGHVFEGFPRSKPETCGYVWAGGGVPTGGAIAMPTVLADVDYSSPDHGLLWMHANKGITFDLDAVRRANPGDKVLRFRAVAGNMFRDSGGAARASADIWVLVDGRARFARRDIDASQGVFVITVPLADKDRFMTLAATDAGNGISPDWIMFGDPRIDLLSTNGTIKKGGGSSSR